MAGGPVGGALANAAQDPCAGGVHGGEEAVAVEVSGPTAPPDPRGQITQPPPHGGRLVSVGAYPIPAPRTWA